MYFHKPLRSTTNSSKLTQAFNSDRPTTTLTSIGSCPNLNRSTVHLLALVRASNCPMHWMGSARIGRMLILKVHFKSRYIDNETHDDRLRGTQGGASVRSSAIRFTSAAVCCHPHVGKTKDMSGDGARHAVGEPPRRVSLASALISSACAPVERARQGGGCALFNVQT